MNEVFRLLIESLEPQLATLLRCKPVMVNSLPKDIPKKGIYLFSEGDTHLYVGRSNRIRERLRSHTQKSGDSYSSTLAFRMARHQTGTLKASYMKKGSRRQLENRDDFKEAFVTAKKRLSKADIRFVAEDDPTRQAVLEIYVATSLKTPFNDFDNH